MLLNLIHLNQLSKCNNHKIYKRFVIRRLQFQKALDSHSNSKFSKKLYKITKNALNPMKHMVNLGSHSNPIISIMILTTNNN